MVHALRSDRRHPQLELQVVEVPLVREDPVHRGRQLLQLFATPALVLNAPQSGRRRQVFVKVKHPLHAADEFVSQFLPEALSAGGRIPPAGAYP